MYDNVKSKYSSMPKFNDQLSKGVESWVRISNHISQKIMLQLSMLKFRIISVSKSQSCGPFYYHGLTLIPTWISNHMPSKVWDEITYPFLNFKSCTVEV